MATKAQVKKLAEKQGAEFSEGYDSSGDYYAEVVLPEPLIWENGYGTGMCIQTKGEDETMSEFWSSLRNYIDWPIIEPR